MNYRQKLIQHQFLNNEEYILNFLKQTYRLAQDDIIDKIKNLQLSIDELQVKYFSLDENSPKSEKIKSQIQSKIYQKQYQDALRVQIDKILDNMNEKAYDRVFDFLEKCYEDGFIGTMFDLQGQGIPLCMPLDQEALVRAVQLNSKISNGLYTRMGENVALLKKHITSQVSRGIATGMPFEQVARQLSLKITGTKYKTGGAVSRAMTIARTEGHRIQIQGGMDACYSAKEKGADVVKQWDSTMDSATRDSHAAVDGEIRELDEKFSNGLMFPGDPSGGAAEVVNCRCALLQRARWVLDDAELETLKERAAYFGLDKTDNFTEYKEKYLRAVRNVDNSRKNGIMKTVKIGKSVGAKAKNYPIKMPSSRQHIKFAEGQEIKGKVFAGKGTNVEIRDRFRIATIYNVPETEIQKVSGKALVVVNGKTINAEVHWYEAKDKKFDFKIKRFLK